MIQLHGYDGTFIRRIIESLPYPFYIIDVKDFTVLLANKVAYFSSVAEGGLCHEMTHNCDHHCDTDEHPCPLAQVIKTGDSVCVEHTHKNHDGTTRVFEICGRPMTNRSGIIDKMIVCSLDITDRKQAGIKLAPQKDKLEHQRLLLEHKNTAMQEMLEQVERCKHEFGNQLQSNLDKIVIPLLNDLEGQTNDSAKHLIHLIREVLTEISIPLVDEFEKRRSQLSPREIQISQMISHGHNTKQIASLLNLSPGTIEQSGNGSDEK